MMHEILVVGFKMQMSIEFVALVYQWIQFENFLYCLCIFGGKGFNKTRTVSILLYWAFFSLK